jgi:catechol 2,3-dioxygenase-like lactoylglutathione lyase family enzyme
MTVRRLDHVAVPVNDMDAMVAFYTAIGFSVDDSMAPIMTSVCCGDMKLNLHHPRAWQSAKFVLRGPTAVPGCGDVCMVWDGSEADLEAMLSAASVEVIEGPVERVGGKDLGSATGTSRYVRDPDDNLLEFIIYS